jgi:hypothetical protein
MDKLVNNGQPTTEWTCSCGHVQQLKVKSLLDIEAHMDYYAFLHAEAVASGNHELQNDIEQRTSALQWVIGWYDNTH